MATYDYDLLVIGAGSAGVRASRVAAELGARVAIAEKGELGGTCVNVGCVPKKLLAYAAHFSDDFEDARSFGWTWPEAPTFDWSALIARKNREIARLNGIYASLLDKAKVDVHRGRAVVVGPHVVEVGGARVSAERILVATGSRPRATAIPGAEHMITSDQAFFLPELPRRVVVAGGGYIGVEFASILHGMGAAVTLLHRGNQLLRGFDEDLRSFLGEQLQARGIDLRLGRTIDAVGECDFGLHASLSDGSSLDADAILYAIGRDPNTEGLGLEEVGAELAERGRIVVDDDYRTSVPSIFAIGDVIDRVQLTPVAIHEAIAFSRSQFGPSKVRLDYEHIPTAVFSHPNVGTVGLSEELAHHECGNVVIYRSDFRPLKLTLTDRQDRTLMKLVVDGDTQRVLGCHMVGPDAGEIIQGFAVALRCGVTKPQLDATVGIHPTSAEEFVTMRVPARGHPQ